MYLKPHSVCIFIKMTLKMKEIEEIKQFDDPITSN